VLRNSIPRTIRIIAFSVVCALLLWLGSRNSPDPLWQETADLIQETPTLLYEQPDSLQRVYCSLHGISYRKGDSTAWYAVAYPYLSTIEWSGFSELVQTALKQRFIVVAGVTGAGATKYSKHLGRLLAGRPERLLEINCAPQFDLEYYKKYIGHEKGEQFKAGILLDFWNLCLRRPDERFAVVIDNFDKINPETFFGPALWEALSNPEDSALIGGRRVAVPGNCYLISATHHGPGSIVEFNQEHFKRLGRQYILKPNLRESLLRLQGQREKLTVKKNRSPEEESRLAALSDTAQLHRYLFFQAKTNQMVRKRYGAGFMLGQGSNVRNYYRPEDMEYLKYAFINHINALHAGKPLEAHDFDCIEYSLKNNGLEENSNFFARQIRLLQDTGYLVEISMVALTALVTALVGWWVFRRREQLIREYGERAQSIFTLFEQQQLSADAAARQLEDIKKEVDILVMRRRLNYTEALYFLAFIEDKVKRIEFARNVSENFLELFNAFMEDNVLTESEYQKLMQFLQSIRHKVPEEIYLQYYEKVQRTYNRSREK
jgi:hypothetical protein